MNIARWIGFGTSALVHGSLLLVMPALFAETTKKPDPEIIPISLAMFEPPPVPELKMLEALPEPVIQEIQDEVVSESLPEAIKPAVAIKEPVLERQEPPKPEKPVEKPKPDQEKLTAEQQKREQEKAAQQAEQTRLVEEQRLREAEQARLQQLEQEKARLAELERLAQERILVEQRKREWEAKRAAEAHARVAEQQRLAQEHVLAEQRRREWEQAQEKARQQQAREQALAREVAEQRQREQLPRIEAAKRTQTAKSVASSTPMAEQGSPIVMKPSFRSKPRAPDYPERALQAGIEGTVIVRAQVSPQGQAISVQVHQSSGHLSLDAAALKAVRTWEFIPAQRDGQSIASIVQVPVNFNLN